jgi:hypothetical protein
MRENHGCVGTSWQGWDKERAVRQVDQTLESGLKRLNWGCGPCIAPGWINSDRNTDEGIDLNCVISERGFL